MLGPVNLGEFIKVATKEAAPGPVNFDVNVATKLFFQSELTLKSFRNVLKVAIPDPSCL